MYSSEKISRKIFVSVFIAAFVFPAIIFAEADFEKIKHELNSRDWEVRLSAVEKLENRKDMETIDLLMKVADTRSEYWPVKIKAITLLGEIKNTKSIDLLLSIFNDTFLNWECPSIKSYTALALGNFKGNFRVVNALINGVNDPELLIREASIRSLGKIGSPAAVNTLIHVLNDSSFAVRLSAIRSLGEIGDQQAIPELQRIAENEIDTVVKEEAKAALNSLRQRAEYK